MRVSPAAWQDVLDQGVGPGDKGSQNALILHNGKGERLPCSTFYGGSLRLDQDDRDIDRAARNGRPLHGPRAPHQRGLT